MIQRFKNGKKIHIKESQKGSFTRYCGGNVTSECIARGKTSPDPRIRKKATFADNARKWNHQEGGTLYQNNTNYENDFGPIDYTTIHIDEESLKPYNNYFFGLQNKINLDNVDNNRENQDLKILYTKLHNMFKK